MTDHLVLLTCHYSNETLAEPAWVRPPSVKVTLDAVAWPLKSLSLSWILRGAA
ncbi:hypothetical protein D3C87_2059510 [compost metagenome]